MIKKIIIFLLVTIIVKLYLINQTKLIGNSIELFSNNLINIVSKKEMDVILKKSNYFKQFNLSDIKARKLNDKDIHSYYLKKIKEPSENEIELLNNYTNSIINELPKNNKKKFLLETWNYVLFENLENNFPHTHENIILLPRIMLQSNYNTIKQTLVHEKVHNFQKLNANLFDDLYINYWHFKKINKFNIPFHTRANPDTLDINWLFTYKNVNIVMLAKYNDNPKNITSVSYIGYNIDTNSFKPLFEIDEFKDFFGNNYNSNFYHPYEISAEMISQHCFNTEPESKAYSNLKKWWKKIE